MAAWGNKKYYQIQSVKGKFITSLGTVSKLCLHYLIVPVSIFNSINEVYETEVSQLITDKARQWSGVGPIKKWSECWVEFKQLSQHVGRSLSHSHKAQFSGHCGLLILGNKFRPLHLHNRTHQLCICQNNKKLPFWRTSANHSFCAQWHLCKVTHSLGLLSQNHDLCVFVIFTFLHIVISTFLEIGQMSISLEIYFKQYKFFGMGLVWDCPQNISAPIMSRLLPTQPNI